MNDKQQYRKELLKQSKKIFNHRKVESFFKDDIWSADLIDLQNIAEQNDDIKYLLLIIDIYSRYIWVFSLKNKMSNSILSCFKKLEEKGNLPVNLWTDLGSEFINNSFRRWCETNKINLYHTGGESKAVFAERCIRTIKNKIKSVMIEDNTDRYIDNLDEIVDDYNNKIHSSIKETPYDVYFENKKPKVEYVYYEIKKPLFKVDDFVRISRIKGTFEKGHMPNWSEEVFKITKVDTKYNPVMYQLVDLLNEPIKGKFYTEELQKTNLQDYAIVEKILKEKKVKGSKMFFVKYRGYDEKFNEWINEKQLESLR